MTDDEIAAEMERLLVPPPPIVPVPILSMFMGISPYGHAFRTVVAHTHVIGWQLSYAYYSRYSNDSKSTISTWTSRDDWLGPLTTKNFIDEPGYT